MEGDINPTPEKRKISESETELIAKKPRKVFIGWFQNLFREKVKSQSLENWTLNSLIFNSLKSDFKFFDFFSELSLNPTILDEIRSA